MADLTFTDIWRIGSETMSYYQNKYKVLTRISPELKTAFNKTIPEGYVAYYATYQRGFETARAVAKLKGINLSTDQYNSNIQGYGKYKIATYNALIFMIEEGQDRYKKAFAEPALKLSIQNSINQITGPDKIVMQDQLNSYITSLNAYKPVKATNTATNRWAFRYGNTIHDYYYKSSNQTEGSAGGKLRWNAFSTWYINFSNWARNLERLNTLNSTAANIVLQQAATREALRREAEGYYNHFLSLIGQVTGDPKLTYQNEANQLVQFDYEPQIAGFTVLNPKVEATIIKQQEDAAIAAAEAVIAAWTPTSIDIEAVRVTIINTATRQQIYDQLQATLAMPDTQAKVDAFNTLIAHVLFLSASELYNIRLIEVNAVITALPIDLGELLWEELKQIQLTTDLNNTQSLKVGLDKLTNLLPRIETRLAQLLADKIAETIAIEEAARLAELILIEQAQDEAKELQILTLMQVANNLLAQLSPALSNTFAGEMSAAQAYDLTEQFAFYTALVPEMQATIVIEQDYADMTAAEATGLSHEIIDNLSEATDYIASQTGIQDADALPLEAAQTGLAANILPLMLAAGTLYFTTL